jgi:hypothetical protein
MKPIDLSDKKIAIIGGGIAGLSAYNILLKYNVPSSKNMKLYTLNFGGDFMNGGFKYYKDSPYMRFFINNVMNLKYKVIKVKGAIHHTDFNTGTEHYINSYPDFLYYNNIAITNTIGEEFVKLFDLQKNYWNKTRPDEKFDNRCMNDPWSYEPELKLVIKDGNRINNELLVNSMIRNVTNYEIVKLTGEMIKELIKENDLVIYTLPFHILNDIYGVTDLILSNKQLNLYCYKLSDTLMDKIFWDYLYVPDKVFPFHRMSFNDNGNLWVECNTAISEESMYMELVDFFRKNYGSSGYDITDLKQHRVINGQIGTDLDDYDNFKEKMPGNVFLLGRFAQWNKRITFDKDVERVLSTFVNIDETDGGYDD